MKPYRLTPRAEARLTEIAGWTIDNFDVEQALRYEQQLIDRLGALARGDLPHGKRCEQLLPGPRKNMPELWYYREGRHYIVYQDLADRLIVIDFIHGSRNLEQLLAEMKPR